MLDAQLKFWFLRLHFALLLLVFGELVAWQSIGGYSPADGLAILGIYLALAAALLDLVARLRVNDLKSLLLLAGVFGLLHSMIISLAVADPTHLQLNLSFRPLGLQVLMFLLAFFSFRLLHSGRASGIFAPLIGAVLGLGWGLWVRWSSSLEGMNSSSPALEDSLPWLILALVAVGLLPRLRRPDFHAMTAEDWLLSPYEWAFAGGILAIAGLLRSQYVSSLGAGIAGLLVIFILFMLALSRQMRRRHYLEAITPPRPPVVIGWLIALLPFILLALLSYRLSGASDEVPAYANAFFTALMLFGLGWLPLVSILLGIGLYSQLIREGY